MTNREVNMVEMRASIFELLEAKKRAGLKIAGETDAERLERGRSDRAQFVVATTMFKATLPADVPVHGSIDFGVPRTYLSQLIASWERMKDLVSITGVFTVNYVTVDGELTVDFAKEVATFSYSLYRPAVAEAA